LSDGTDQNDGVIKVSVCSCTRAIVPAGVFGITQNTHTHIHTQTHTNTHMQLDSLGGNSEARQAECLAQCAAVDGHTGCELIWNQDNQGCYAHTSTISNGNGVDNHYCWVGGVPEDSRVPVLDPWDVEASVTWVQGDQGESCDTVCGASRQICREEVLGLRDSAALAVMLGIEGARSTHWCLTVFLVLVSLVLGANFHLFGEVPTSSRSSSSKQSRLLLQELPLLKKCKYYCEYCFTHYHQA
jgi:hypothetical protein